MLFHFFYFLQPQSSETQLYIWDVSLQILSPQFPIKKSQMENYNNIFNTRWVNRLEEKWQVISRSAILTSHQVSSPPLRRVLERQMKDLQPERVNKEPGAAFGPHKLNSPGSLMDLIQLQLKLKHLYSIPKFIHPFPSAYLIQGVMGREAGYTYGWFSITN